MPRRPVRHSRRAGAHTVLTAMAFGNQGIHARIRPASHAILDFVENRLHKILRRANPAAAVIDQINLYSAQPASPKDAVTFITSQTKQYSASADSKWAEQLFRFLAKHSPDFASVVLDAIQDKLERFSMLPYYADIASNLLKYAQLSKVFAQNPKGYENLFAPMLDIYRALEWDGDSIDPQACFLDTIRTPFDFMNHYCALQKASAKLEQFKKGHYTEFVPELLSFTLDMRYDLYQSFSIEDDYHLFASAALLNSVYGSVDSSRRLIFIDEFQDLSVSELKLLKDAFPNSTFNLYGDTKQCISPKGITNAVDIFAVDTSFCTYEIAENYRNALEITQYINSRLGSGMRPIGIPGQVFDTKTFDSNMFRVTPNDRIAYIAKDKNHFDYTLMNSLGILEGWKGSQAEVIPHEVPVAMTVQDVKGLEFEVVIVDDRDMDENEKYVAYTRALDRLYVVHGT